jgi:hypothetical protein
VSDPLDNCLVTALVIDYQSAENAEIKSDLFRRIAETVVPLIQSTIFRHKWDKALNETSNALVNEVITKLPAILLKWKPDKGTTFFNYFMSGLLNCFRHMYAKRQRRAKYHSHWPTDEEGNLEDLPDTRTTNSNGDRTTALARGHEYERLMSEIPLELSRLVNPEFGGLVHYIAERYLTRADNGEQLYFTQLRGEVSALPVARSLSEWEVDSLIRMVVGGVRARLYALHFNKAVETESEETVRDLLRTGSHRLWPLLMLFQPAQTVMLLHCLGGVHDSVPPRDRWFKESSNRSCHVSEPVPRDTARKITQELLQNLFELDAEKGWLIYRKARTKARGKPFAGSMKWGGRRKGCLAYYIKIGNKFYRRARLVFLYRYGYLPKFIDHINRDTTDDRPENLRGATLSLNAASRTRRRDKKGPWPKGVTMNRDSHASPSRRFEAYVGGK